jgi:hypothetical protein
LNTTRKVGLYELILPEFSQSSRIDHVLGYIFTGTCAYDIVFGRDFLHLIGMNQDFSTGTMTALGVSVEMKPKSFYKDPLQALIAIIDDQQGGESFATQIKESLYEKVDVKVAVRG